MNASTLYPLGLDRLQWAERRELVMTMREARGIASFAARFIGCSIKKVHQRILQFQVSPAEYGGQPFPKSEAAPTCDDNNLRAVVRQEILKALRDCGWNKIKAAKRLGIGRQTLYNRMDKLQISLDA